MSTEKQQNMFDIGVENERRTAQYHLNEINALYSESPCCKHAARVAYLEGRFDRAMETLISETKHLEQCTAETDQAVHGNGDNPVRTMSGDVRPRVRASAKA